jgi:hypothetical protein
MPDTNESRERVMARPDLENLPRFDLPEGFSLHSYQAGDEEAWLDIHRRADIFNTFTPHTFAHQFGTDSQVLEARQKYLRRPTARYRHRERVG